VLRPAAVLGVQGGLAESVAGELDGREGRVVGDYGIELARRCAELPATDEYTCSIGTVPLGGVGSSGIATTRYRVDAGFFGCWEARKTAGHGPTTLDAA